MWQTPAVVLISGIMAAGKSTVAELLARRLPRAVHLRGDLFRRMVVTGRADVTAQPCAEAWRQLQSRYDLAALVADLDAEFRADTPRIGLWLDTSAQSPAQTVDEILAGAWTDARIG
ncbi:hypothetical protein DLJ46_01905 [Micromonospora globispora]|uniref:Phosphotransferase n=1 Tax=Micromonospora globispora TaxID=1450148 RepID=A0A317KH84_9ACTN|nr:zeta toxin family protein [Micromonospora globispora]PWU53070.1 hypothetical protein DLJ46_01905 [Micromonospora globispora]